jgi:hypothetical protein
VDDSEGILDESAVATAGSGALLPSCPSVSQEIKKTIESANGMSISNEIILVFT